MQLNDTGREVSRPVWLAFAFFGPALCLPLITPLVVGLIHRDRDEIATGARVAFIIQAATLFSAATIAISALMFVTPAQSDDTLTVFVLLLCAVPLIATVVSVAMWAKYSFGSTRSAG